MADRSITFGAGGRSITLIVVIATVLATLSVGSLAASVTGEWDDVNEDANAAPNIQQTANVTKEIHDMADYGTGAQALRTYEDDNGDTAVLAGVVNDSWRNHVSFAATEVNFSDATQFPRKDDETGDNSASWTDKSEWTKGGDNSSKLSISEVTNAPGVDGLQFSTSSMGANDVAYLEYSNFSKTSDVKKRQIQVALDVDTLDSSAKIEVRLYDSDGSYAITYINPSYDASAVYTVANSTGDGWVYQEQVGDVIDSQGVVNGNGDGTLDDLSKVEFRVLDADADVTLTAFNIEKLSQWDFGERMIDDDGDGTKDESETIRQQVTPGDLNVTGLDTLGSTFDDARIRNLKFALDKTLAHADKVNLTVEEAPDYQYEYKATLRARWVLPSAYDVDYSNADLNDTSQALPSSRYGSVGKATNVGEDTDLINVSYTDITSSYSSKGDPVTIITGASEGSYIAVEYERLLLTPDGAKTLPPVPDDGSGSSGGGGGGFFSGGASGVPIIGGMLEAIMGVFTGIAAVLGLSRRKRKQGG